jgi:glycosyltransferase involved in cell wall biosynthesis
MQPLVSVRILAYNHEKYIVKCLESVLMQRTNFPYEVIIGEDCSTDGTREIVFDYEKKYPEIIRVITAEQNVGPQRNIDRINQACRGQYRAICEGDDYWIDPLKLQKQVDFMMAHPEIVMCFHNAFFVKEGTLTAHLYIPFNLPEILTFPEVIKSGIPTASSMVRGDIFTTLPEWRLNLLGGDRFFWLWCAHIGKVGYLKEVMSVYRRHSEGLIARTNKKEWISGTISMLEQFDQETGYQHTDLIRPLIKQFLWRKHLGRFSYLIYPGKLIARLKVIAGWAHRIDV